MRGRYSTGTVRRDALYESDEILVCTLSILIENGSKLRFLSRSTPFEMTGSGGFGVLLEVRIALRM